MSTFASIGLTLGVATCFLGVAMTGFSCAVECQANGSLAPRTYARPKEVIKNVLKRPFSIRWIFWALSLTYLKMLQGIEGTGTRNNGWSGTKLCCNLDGIILLRYHSLCLKVSVFATILCIGIILPINTTAPCNPELVGNDICTNMTYLTDFENTTLAHIPILDFSDNPQGGGLNVVGSSFRNAPGLTLRLWTIVFVAYAIYAYTCVLIWEQWIENLALRRVYYLEYNHYVARREELEEIENFKDPEDQRQMDRPPFLPHPELRDTVPNVSLYSVLYKLPSVHFATIANVSSSEVQRQLEMAVEFFDKAVPNQPGYSSSVAAVTILPDVNQVSRAWKKWFECASKLRRLRFIRKRLHQLQEGQRRSVEIVFSHTEQDQIVDLNLDNIMSYDSSDEYNIEKAPLPLHNNSDSVNNGNSKLKEPNRNPPPRTHTPGGTLRKLEKIDEGSAGDLSATSEIAGISAFPSDILLTNSKKEKLFNNGRTTPDETRLLSAPSADSDSTDNIGQGSDGMQIGIDSLMTIQAYKNEKRNARIETDLRKDRFLASVGVAEESKLEMFLTEDDIEQMTVYCREFARSSATCCPYGCDEYSILRADAATLADLEQEAEDAVQIANDELRRARAEVNRRELSQDVPVFKTSSEDNLMMDQLLGIGVASSHSSPEKNSSSAENGQVKIQASSRHFCGHTIKPTNRASSLSKQWEEAEKLVESERNVVNRGGWTWKRKLAAGHWHNPFESAMQSSIEISRKEKLEGLSNVIDTDSYAVVTFTSRQAAIAARQCLADGCGLDRWREVEAIPIPPLADAPPWNILDCRGCCRPVTVTLPHEQKRWRRNFVVAVVVLFCLSYTIPLTYFSALVTPAILEETFPEIPQIGRLSGLLSGGMRTLFFALCPQIFKMLANFGSGATSVQHAERSAIKYYWFFMLATAFTGTSLATVIYEGFVQSFDVGGVARGVLRNVASTVPTTVSAQWLSWIIFRSGITLPYNYLLQFNNFLFSGLRLNCCARATAGGGPGGVAPFRIYVDCGVVFLCVVGLAPACPLVAPCAMLCYLILIPMLRWLVIFTYRPHYDGGGTRWPLLHNILISSMIWAQIVLAAMMGVKRAYSAAIMAGLAIIPTYTFHVVCKDRYLQCYKDAGLLQTSELDGWNVEEETSMKQREGFRRWLVDCHKASYIPVCVNGEDNILSAEPAVVIATDRDKPDVNDPFQQFATFLDSPERSSTGSPASGGGRQRASTFDSFASRLSQSSAHQRGALYRRIQGRGHGLPPRESSMMAGGRLRTVSGSSAPVEATNNTSDEGNQKFIHKSI